MDRLDSKVGEFLFDELCYCFFVPSTLLRGGKVVNKKACP